LCTFGKIFRYLPPPFPTNYNPTANILTGGSLPMKNISLLAALPIAILLGLPGLPAAADAEPSAGGAAATVADPAAMKDPLLPDIMSPGEKLLWGEHGWMRSLAGLPLNEESREKEMGIRRTMLTLHQAGGYVTLASMLATAFCGQMIINGHESYEDYKSGLAWTTVGLYFTTAAFSLLSPPPIIRRSGFSSLTVHKTLAWVHFSGMLITPILGTFIEDEHKVRIFHQTAGYVTTAAFAGAMISITLF
jgi:hypothetical protein